MGHVYADVLAYTMRRTAALRARQAYATTNTSTTERCVDPTSSGLALRVHVPLTSPRPMSAWLSRHYTLHAAGHRTDHTQSGYQRFSQRFSSSSDDVTAKRELYEHADGTAGSRARRIVRKGRESLTQNHRRSLSVGGRATHPPVAAAATAATTTLAMLPPMHEAKDERVTVGSMHLTVSLLQGPQNHAIWRARLLAALNAEDEALYAAATGALPLDVLDDHAPDAASAQQAAADERDMEHRRRAHIRCVAFITSTLPDSVYAMVMHHTNDACKLIESLDTRFRPYPRYAGVATQSTAKEAK